MNKERLNLLENYIKSGVSPVLIKNIPSSAFNNSVIIKSNIDRSELNGHYENTEFCPPQWYKELLAKSKASIAGLVIEYKKVSTFELPKNCLVIVTCSDLTTNKINEEVYSLLAQI